MHLKILFGLLISMAFQVPSALAGGGGGPGMWDSYYGLQEALKYAGIVCKPHSSSTGGGYPSTSTKDCTNGKISLRVITTTNYYNSDEYLTEIKVMDSDLITLGKYFTEAGFNCKADRQKLSCQKPQLTIELMQSGQIVYVK